MIKIAPSILAADFYNLGEQIRELEKAGADYLHIDVMDGMFVPSISFGMPIVESLRKRTKLFFDVHLMIEKPMRYVKEFIVNGADSITIHAEACDNMKQALWEIKRQGVKACVSIKPDTDISVLFDSMEYIDMVLIMSVEPGFGGQSFKDSSLAKIRDLRDYCEKHGYDIDIEVDGGINKDNLLDVLEAGANVIVAGTSVFKGNITDNISQFRKIIEKYQAKQ